jgi:hypothetical protein
MIAAVSAVASFPRVVEVERIDDNGPDSSAAASSSAVAGAPLHAIPTVVDAQQGRELLRRFGAHPRTHRVEHERRALSRTYKGMSQATAAIIGGLR